MARGPLSLAAGDSWGKGQKVGELLTNVPEDVAGSVLCSLLVEGELWPDRNHKIPSFHFPVPLMVRPSKTAMPTPSVVSHALSSAIREDRQAALSFMESFSPVVLHLSFPTSFSFFSFLTL